MTIVDPLAVDPRPRSPYPVKRFTVAEYEELIRLGFLGEDDHVELLEGWLVPKVTRNPPHDFALAELTALLVRLIPPDWVVRNQSAIRLPDSVPEPDLVVAHGPRQRYAEAHPVARDIALIVEVSDSSLTDDRGPRLQLYARHRIAVYWIVNLLDGVIEVYARPRAGRNPTYRSRTDYRPGDAVPVVLACHELGSIAAAEVLP